MMDDFTIGKHSSPSHLPIIRLYGIPLGAQISDKTSQNSIDLEELPAVLRFEQRGKLDELLTQIEISVKLKQVSEPVPT
jgi:hypothetical protein